MWFKRLILLLIATILALIAIAFGTLFVVCVTLYVLWHGLSVSVIAFGLLCMVFVAVACISLRRALAKDKALSEGDNPVLLADKAGLFSEPVTARRPERHTIG